MAQEEAKLFVRGLADGITESVLKRIFQEAGGTVVQVSVPKDRETGRPRGIAFITMGSGDQAKQVMQTLDGSIHGGRSISVRPYEATPPRRDDAGGGGADRRGPPSGGPRPQASPDKTLYVGNLPFDCTQQEIEELIGAHGQVQRVHMPIGPDGRRRGFGFVTMGSSDAANAAMAALQGSELRGRRLIINIAQPRGDRPARSPDFSGGPGGGFPFAPPPPPPSSRRFLDKPRKKANSVNFEDGNPAKRGAAGAGKKKSTGQDNWDDHSWRSKGIDDWDE